MIDDDKYTGFSIDLLEIRALKHVFSINICSLNSWHDGDLETNSLLGFSLTKEYIVFDLLFLSFGRTFK